MARTRTRARASDKRTVPRGRSRRPQAPSASSWTLSGDVPSDTARPSGRSMLRMRPRQMGQPSRASRSFVRQRAQHAQCAHGRATASARALMHTQHRPLRGRAEAARAEAARDASPTGAPPPPSSSTAEEKMTGRGSAGPHGPGVVRARRVDCRPAFARTRAFAKIHYYVVQLYSRGSCSHGCSRTKFRRP